MDLQDHRDLAVPQVLPAQAVQVGLYTPGKVRGKLRLDTLLMIVLKMMVVVMYVFQVIHQAIQMMNLVLVRLGRLTGIY